MYRPFPFEKKLADPPGPISRPDHESTFVGGFSPELLALNATPDNHPLVSPLRRPSTECQSGRAARGESAPVPHSKEYTDGTPLSLESNL